MKTRNIILSILAFVFLTAAAQWQRSMSIGGSGLDASSLFDVISTTLGSRPAPSMTEIQRDAISTPATGLQVFNTDTNAVNIYDGSNWTAVGSGGGQGGINYIINTDYEESDDDVTVTANLTAAVETVDPLRGVQSLGITIDTLATTADHAALAMIDVDNKDLGKATFISFDYETDANYTTDDVKVILRNTDSSADIAVTGGNGSGQIAASNGKVSFTGVAYLDSCVTPADCNSYELRLVVVTAPSSDSVITVDNVIVGPQKILDAPIIGEWTAFTPTGAWTSNTTYTGMMRRIGDSVEVNYRLVLSGAPNSATLVLNPPPGLTPDETKMLIVSGNFVAGSRGQILDTGAARYKAAVRYQSATDDFLVSVSDISSSFSRWGSVNQSIPMTFTSPDEVEVSFTFPVVEYGGQSALFSDKELLNTPVRVTARRSTAQSIPNATDTILRSLSQTPQIRF